MNAAKGMPQASGVKPGAGRMQSIVVLAVTVAVIVLAALLLGGKGFGQSDGSTEIDLSGTPTVGGVPPAFSGTTFDGKSVSLAQYSGKPLWLTFGATWCQDCRSETPDVEATYQKYQAQGLNLLGVFKQESASDISTYASRSGITFPILVDQAASIANRYAPMGIPTHFFIGADGRIKDIKFGALDPATMDREVQAILAK
jgi:cytochrome c biogenesis protein CcmG, thiol:disulfide interchange protein DsbE